LGQRARRVSLFSPGVDFALAIHLLALSPGSAPAADAEHGKTLFQTCVACHSERPDALGPSLKGVVGRKAAALEDFRYSNPMKRANLVWDEDNLRAFIKDPQGKVKGNRMPYGGLTDAADIEDVIAYLKMLNY
jgi:cytochrome c